MGNDAEKPGRYFSLSELEPQAQERLPKMVCDTKPEVSCGVSAGEHASYCLVSRIVRFLNGHGNVLRDQSF